MVSKKLFLSILFTGLWITLSEFVRNELLFKNYWVEHYNSLGLTFETLPINGVIWMLWSFTFTFIIFGLLQKYSFKETLLFAWLAGFVLMWLTLYNLQVLPMMLLLIAVPLSILEVVVAEIIILKLK